MIVPKGKGNIFGCNKKLCFVLFTTLLLISCTEGRKVEKGYWARFYNFLADWTCTLKTECCRPPFVLNSAAGELRKSLKAEFFGQHIAVQTVLNALEAHLRDEDPKKPLVLSFHGWAGSGKTFLAHLIANAIYQNGVESNYVKMYSAHLDFPDKDRVAVYKARLQKDIVEKLRLCERSLLVFDEVDYTPPGVFDALVPFLDFSRIEGVNHKKAIYIFLSNIGSTEISNIALQTWRDGKRREDLTFNDFHVAVSKAAFNAVQTGWEKARIIERHLVDFFIPFLPMERRHVIACAKVEIKRQNADINPESIADQMDYWPDDLKLFSRTGCKRVEPLVKYAVSERDFKNQEKSEL